MPEGVVDHWIEIVGELGPNFAERAERERTSPATSSQRITRS